MGAPGAVRCPLPHLLGMPLVMVPLGEDLRQPNKGAYQAEEPTSPALVYLCLYLRIKPNFRSGQKHGVAIHKYWHAR